MGHFFRPTTAKNPKFGWAVEHSLYYRRSAAVHNYGDIFMTILVLSATGTTGRATVRALLTRGARVRAATRSMDSASFEVGVEVVRFDPLERSTWSSALSGVDAMYFCLPTALTEEVELSLALIEAAAVQGVQRIVMLSAFRADVITYAPHKRLEAAIEASGVRWIHLRPNFFAENFITMLSPENMIALPAGGGRISFVTASDVGEAAAEALLGDDHGEIWTLTGPEALDHEQVASILGETLGRNVQYVDIAPEAYAEMLTQYMGMDAQKATNLSMVFSVDVAQNEYAPVLEDLPRVLGRPATSFMQWAQANAEAFAS